MSNVNETNTEKDAFDFEKWKSKCIQFRKNKDGMSLKSTVAVVDGKLSIKILSIDEKYVGYKKMIKNLMCSIAKESVTLMCNYFTASYAMDDDFDNEELKNKNLVAENATEYLNVLFNDGYERFLNVISVQSMILKAIYDLKRIHYKDGWCLNGYKWENGVWSNGETRWTDCSLDVLNTLMGYRPSDPTE